MTARRPFGSIAITGASSGLGAALARGFAAPGVSLSLVGRNPARLEAVAEACRAAGAEAATLVHDVGEAEPLGRWLTERDARYPFDLVIANAGTSAGPAPGSMIEGLALSAGQVRTNLLGALHTVEPLLPALVARRAGHVAVVASIAAYRGLAYSPAYSASKSGVRTYGEALRALLAPAGIGVSVICPGFFASPMTDRFIGARPWAISLERAAAKVRRGLDRRRRRIAFPWPLVFGLRCADLMPAWLGDRIIRGFHFHIVPG